MDPRGDSEGIRDSSTADSGCVVGFGRNSPIGAYDDEEAQSLLGRGNIGTVLFYRGWWTLARSASMRSMYARIIVTLTMNLLVRASSGRTA